MSRTHPTTVDVATKLLLTLILTIVLSGCGIDLAQAVRPKGPAATATAAPRVAPPTQPAASSGPSSPQPSPTVVPATGTSPSNPVLLAIQSVIQRTNDEQGAAFTSHDPTVMQDTTTTSYYNEVVQANADLAKAGGSAIKLLKLEWGPITLQGSNGAVATTFETWQTTYSAGQTEIQDQERNVYTLVLVNGSWKIQSDDHPDSQGAQPGAGGPTGRIGTPTPVTAPSPVPSLVTPGADQSRNWAGYSATGGTFTSVTGTWIVPRINAAAASGAAGDATWVGIGGVSGRDLIQAGTEAEVVAPRDTVYSTWVELLPNASQTVPLVVIPGDSVTIVITEGDPGHWTVEFKNNTTAQTYQTMVQYQSSHSSAEWVEEAPSGGRRIVPLDNFGTVEFSAGSAVRDGKTLTIAQANGQPIIMMDRGRQPLATPSELGSDGRSFRVTRT